MTMDEMSETFHSVRDFSDRRSSLGKDYSGYLLKASQFGIDSYYMEVLLEGTKGSLKLDILGIVFSPDDTQIPQRSWSWASIQKHYVKEHAMQIKVKFRPTPDQPELDSIIFSLPTPEELKRLMKDLGRRIKRSVVEEQEPTDAKESAPLVAGTSETAPESDEPDEEKGKGAARIPGDVVRKLSTKMTSLKGIEKFVEEEEHDEMETALTEDIYSLLFTANPRGLGFWFAALTFGCQISVLLQICKYNTHKNT
jgi:FERM C-terminal PH-like domain